MISTKVTKDQTNGHTNGYTDHYSNGGSAANGQASELSRSDLIDQKDVHKPIAIIGMGMRLPGGVHNAEAYWNLLVNGKDGRCQVPKDRYNIDTWYGPGRVTHVVTKYGHFLEELNLANINFKTPNPKIPWEEAKLKVPLRATSWLADKLERVAVNSFGIGGANAHDIPFCWVTGACQIDCKNPDYALVNGMARSIRQETGIDLVTFELELFGESAWGTLSVLLETFLSRVIDGEMDTDIESEYAFHAGTIQVGRMHWINVNSELQDKGPGVRMQSLVIDKPGIIQTLHWKQKTSPVLKGENWVQVDTRAVGLNFKDILIAMGIVEATNDGLVAGDFGFEGAGVVARVGSGVQHLVVGDRVAFSSTGCFSTLQAMPEIYCTKIHEYLTFEEAATMQCVFGTAMYGLVDLARLEAGQSVLIHSACGGIRQAAIQIAKMIGAEIFCTVGSEGKIEYLMSVFGIPRDHIFNSRDSSFRQGIVKATYGRGVDVVLNSFSGELLHELWNCVARFGIMVEIGKRDFMGKAELAMDRFDNDRTFVGLDHTELWAHKPKVASRVLNKIMELCGSATQFAESNPAFFEELASLGCSTQVASGNINNRADVEKAVASAINPIAGVLQAAMDANFVDMNFDVWQTAVLPKVLGTWNFEEALKK
ncbi:polyketide synthase [Fusarium heterosporum]|uniref:Polyketide synthase n=1 Tax=Fusarium heterosporum TaxID=42747 RepID=A0A8H5T8E1_FUSHE|nr:polyketide synthase [Fusarium heterosporum]